MGWDPQAPSTAFQARRRRYFSFENQHTLFQKGVFRPRQLFLVICGDYIDFCKHQIDGKRNSM